MAIASNRDYNHGANIRISWKKQGAVAPKRTRDPSFLFENLNPCNINNQ